MVAFFDPFRSGFDDGGDQIDDEFYASSARGFSEKKFSTLANVLILLPLGG